MMLARSTSLSISGINCGGRTEKSGGGDRLTLVGRSRAGDGTSFVVPELKWMFDVGALVQGWKPKIVFLTHTHSDHTHYLTHIKNEDSPPVIYLPLEAERFVEAYYVAHQEMSDCLNQADWLESGGVYKKQYVLRPAVPDESIRFRQSGVEYVVRTLKMDHRIPCLGYSVFKIKKRLKEDYIGLSGREIGRLRKEGVEVTTSVEEPLLCFLGDTTAQAFETHPEILTQHKTVIVECSFIDEDSLRRAETTKHMHWDQLKPIVASNPDVLFVLIHFSLKYSTLELRIFFCEEQKSVRNIHPMLVEEEILEQWQKRKEKERQKKNGDVGDSCDENLVEERENNAPPQCNCYVCKP